MYLPIWLGNDLLKFIPFICPIYSTDIAYTKKKLRESSEKTKD